MHESISPERWCVTYRDLRYLWQEVAEAIRQGNPKPLMWRCDALGSLTLDKYKKTCFSVLKLSQKTCCVSMEQR